MTTMKHTITLLAAAASLACLPCTRADDGATPPATPSSTPPAAPSTPSGDILRGPAVPDSALRPERGNRPLNVTDGTGKFSLPVLEQNVLFIAIDEIRLRGDTLGFGLLPAFGAAGGAQVAASTAAAVAAAAAMAGAALPARPQPRTGSEFEKSWRRLAGGPAGALTTYVDGVAIARAAPAQP
jgi:hypothetical protein